MLFCPSQLGHISSVLGCPQYAAKSKCNRINKKGACNCSLHIITIDIAFALAPPLIYPFSALKHGPSG
jgi:hypothetical protein